MTLKETINNLLDTLMHKTKDYEELSKAHSEIKHLKDNFNSPLTVAVIGLIKAGKSTFINALIQQELLTTNIEEATYTITKVKYNEEAFIEVQLRDGTVEKDQIERLDFWTSRSNLKANPMLNDVEMVTINYPNELFKKIEIVDTPGLGSIHGIDSKNTDEFLGNISQEDKEKSTQLTKREIAKADAVICAFSKNMTSSDMESLKKFLSYFGEIGNPSNSIGIFTKCDAFWEDADDDPFKVANRICTNNYMKRRDVRQVLYTLSPIIALPAQGITKLDDSQYKLFEELGKLDEYNLYDELSFAQSFLENDIENCNVNDVARKLLMKTYGAYGIYLITDLVRQGLSIEEIKTKVYQETGLQPLLNIILKHFGNRANIIKGQNILSRLGVISQNIQFNSNNNSVRIISDFIYDNVDEITSQQHCFKELNMLQYYYNNDIDLSEEDEADLLHVTGEYGYSCENRLNVEEGNYSINELKDLAFEKVKKWGVKANTPLMKRQEKKLAGVLKRSYDIIYYHLENLSDY